MIKSYHICTIDVLWFLANTRRLCSTRLVGLMALFISEQLTKDINNLYYRLRKIVGQNPKKIFTHYTRNGIIMVKEKQGDDPVRIIHEDDLERFLTKVRLPLHPNEG